MKRSLSLFLAILLFTAPLAPAQQPMDLRKVSSITTTMQSSATANGNGTDLNTDGMSVAILTVNCSSCSGGTTINFTSSQDATNYEAVWGQRQTSGAYAKSLTTAGVSVWLFQLNGAKRLRAAIASYSAGTITITGTTIPSGGAAPPAPLIYNATPPTCTDGQPCDLQIDVNGRLLNTPRLGAVAAAHGSNPTAVTAGADAKVFSNRAGILFTIGGHPNTITRTCRWADADGAQTNTACVTVSTGSKIVVTHVMADCDGSNTNPTNIKVGYGTSTLPSDATTGANGILASFDGVPAGLGFAKGNGGGILGIGADDEDVRYTGEDPVGGACSVSVSYFTIES